MNNQLVKGRPVNQKSPTISVIMNCLNGAKYLREAVDSIYAQTYKDWEIIFWDNASEDNSAEIAKSYDEKVRYFRSKETVSLGKARNWAIEKSKGKYIAFLDCDDIWLQTKLEKQIPILEKKPKVGLVFSDSIFFNDKGKVQQLYKWKKPPRGQVFKELLKGYFLSLDTVIVKKEALDSLSEWFDNRFNMIEEAELFLRMAYQGWEFDYIDEPLSKWRMYPESWSFSKKYLYPKEKELMIEKFSTLFDGFEKKFKRELMLFKSVIEYEYAMLVWEKGNNKEVRKRLYPYLFIRKKCFIPYIFSFFPYVYYKKLSGFFKIAPV